MMRDFRLSELAPALRARQVGKDVIIAGVSTDSRQHLSGGLFVALEGEHFDGHNYVNAAVDAGAVAALVRRQIDCVLPQLVVENTQQALGRLGAFNRRDFSGRIVAITGSNGKTTAKNLISAVLSCKGKTLATAGNFNNEIGLPLTLLRLQKGHQFAVLEMGAARAGDIAWLSSLARPDVAVLLNAMPAHLQGFGSVSEVASAKAEIYDSLGEGGIAIINADQTFARHWRSRARKAVVLDYGIEQPAAIRATHISIRGSAGMSFVASTPAGDIPVALKLPGLHNISNALAAIAVGIACDVSLADISAALASVDPEPGRLSVSCGVGGCQLIDDCYNANPGSVRAAIDLLVKCEGQRTLILGAMRELGPDTQTLHAEIGVYAREQGVHRLWGVGPELAVAVDRFGDGGRYFEDREAATAALPGEFGPEDTVLIKGSRGAAMEQVLQALTSEWTPVNKQAES
ncbi:MAG: UDP-N-acetylmuramoyl-tripeptide--D-alanyl-D-alanine ligase [Parahaliea sp.]